MFVMVDCCKDSEMGISEAEMWGVVNSVPRRSMVGKIWVCIWWLKYHMGGLRIPQ